MAKRSSRYNYRGECLQSAIPKLLDSIVSKQIKWMCKQIISDNQHGFMEQRSTVTNLVVYHTYLLNALENKMQVDAIYTDFSKAFDRVNHKILLLKLTKLGFNQQIINWIASFLSERSQWVKINNFISKNIEVPSGVPQGSHCGPILFLLFVDDITRCIKSSECLLFADDIKIFKSVGSDSDCFELQLDIDALTNWCQINTLNLYIKECNKISFSK